MMVIFRMRELKLKVLPKNAQTPASGNFYYVESTKVETTRKYQVLVSVHKHHLVFQLSDEMTPTIPHSPVTDRVIKGMKRS
jgi:hypothetical protein